MENEEAKKWYHIGFQVGCTGLFIMIVPVALVSLFFNSNPLVPRMLNSIVLVIFTIVYVALLYFGRNKLEKWLKKIETARYEKRKK